MYRPFLSTMAEMSVGSLAYIGHINQYYDYYQPHQSLKINRLPSRCLTKQCPGSRVEMYSKEKFKAIRKL